MFIENSHCISQTVGCTPVGQHQVNIRLMNHPVGVAGIFSVSGHILSPDRHHQASKDRVTIAADHQKFIIRALVGIGRHNPSHRSSGWFANHTSPIIFGNHRLKQIKHGLIQSHIHNLTSVFVVFNRLISGAQRHQYTNHRVQARHSVTNTEIGTHRGLPRVAIDVTETANSLTSRGKARLFRIGASLAITRNTRIDQVGVVLAQAFRIQPPVLEHTRAKVFHYNISAF